MSRPKSPSGWLSPFRITAIYLLAGVFWIPVTDWLLVTGTRDVAWISLFQSLKGGLFVVITAALLYLLIRRGVATAREVSMKQAQTALRESEERFRELVEHIDEIFWVSNADGSRVLYVSPAYETIRGHPRQRVYEHPDDWLEAIHPEDRARLGDVHARIQGTAEFNEEYRIVRPEGTVRWIWSRAFPVRNSAGEIYRLAGIFQDITERKQAELELRDRARQQAAVAELGQRALVAGGDLDALLDEAVALVAEVLELDVCKVLELLPERQVLLLRAGVGLKPGYVGQAAVEVGSESQAGYTLLCQEPVIVEDLRTETRFRGAPLLLDHGVISGISVIIPGRDRPFGILGAHTRKRQRFSDDDIHFLQAVATVLAATIERRRVEEQVRLQQAQLAHVARLDMAGEMAAGLAHELNQPLTAIAIYAGAGLRLLNKQADPERLAGVFDKIAEQGRRAGEIIRRLRDLVRKSEAHKSSIELNDLIRDALQLAEIEARQQGIRVRLELAEVLPPVVADSIQLQQVVLNLMRNGIEAMSDTPVEERELVVRTAPAGDGMIEVSVADTGPGLSAEAAQNLFNPFFTTKPTGMGLGLVLSKSLVESHGGRLEVDRDGDRGATFRFVVPAGSE